MMQQQSSRSLLIEICALTRVVVVVVVVDVIERVANVMMDRTAAELDGHWKETRSLTSDLCIYILLTVRLVYCSLILLTHLTP